MPEPAPEPRGGSSFFPIAASFYLALAVTGVVGLGLSRGRLGLELIADPGSWWTDLGLGLGAGALLLGLWELVRRLASGPRRVERELARLIGELTRGEAAALAVVSAIGEEVAFRGAFQSWIGWIPSAILFGVLHLGPGRHYRWWALWAFAGGLGLGLMVDQRGSLGAAILAHLVVNGVQLERLRLLRLAEEETEEVVEGLAARLAALAEAEPSLAEEPISTTEVELVDEDAEGEAEGGAAPETAEAEPDAVDSETAADREPD